MNRTVLEIKAGIVLSGMVMASAFAQETQLYKGKDFTVYSDKVVQGPYTAKVIDRNSMVSDYQSTASKIFPRRVGFKFSINEKDIEMPSGKDHSLIIQNGSHESPVIVFGKQNTAQENADGYLPENYPYTFRLDLRPVLKQFDEKGYYTAFDGTRIAKNDFKGVYIAGGSAPLSWDFVNLASKGLELKDPDGDGIYEITVILNPVEKGKSAEKKWTLTRDISEKPVYTSNQPLVDALFRMSTEESQLNIEADNTFRTGALWSGVWTRDISYSILLAFAYLEPETAKTSLMKKVKRGRIIQDTGSGGAWPVSSDRTTWALAAWEIYKTTGDTEWLKSSYEILKNTIDDDNKTIYNPATGMYRGESSFLDWREQTYPKWMDNRDIYISENLGTNAVHYEARRILASMGRILGKDVKQYDQQAEKIKEGINRYLWQPDKGYYAQYLYGRDNWLNVSHRFEALGEALSILFDVADESKTKEIIAKSPVTEFGTTNIFPQIPGIPPYHNNAVWPFVQSYYNLAAAKAGNETVLNYGIASIYRPAALFLTNYENFVAQNGDYVGTEINSYRMLWSMAGNLSIVYRIFMGMHFEENGITFRPAVPETYNGTKNLANFKYRNAVLDITVKGFGNKIKSFVLDGKPSKAYFPATLTGKHTVVIELDNHPFHGEINMQPMLFSPDTPNATVSKNIFSWEKQKDAAEYRVYRNDQLLKTTKETSVAIDPSKTASYKVSAVDTNGYEGFTSEPHLVYANAASTTVEIEKFVPKSDRNYINFSGNGFVELTKEKNTDITIKVNAKEAGTYLINFRYSNGSGPRSTDNRCAIRSLYLNGAYEGVIVMPQRGQNEWSDWGNSNDFTVKLKKGENTIRIKFDDWNNNMNVDDNTAMLDYAQIIKL